MATLSRTAFVVSGQLHIVMHNVEVTANFSTIPPDLRHQTEMATTRPTTTFSAIFNEPAPSTSQHQTSSSRARPFTMGALDPADNPFSPQDPCSFFYQRRSTRPASIHSKVRYSRRAAIKQLIKHVARSAKRAFAAAKGGFSHTRTSSSAIPTSRASASKRRTMLGRRSFRRSRRSFVPARMSNQVASPTHSQLFIDSPQVEVIGHTPSGKRYNIHSYFGPDSHPSQDRQSVLFTHPAVAAVLPEALTPMTTYSNASDEWSTNDERHFSANAGEDASVLSDLTGKVNPKSLYRMSIEASHAPSTAQNFQVFCNTLDGVKQQPQARKDSPAQSAESSQASLALPFIAKTPSLTSDGASDWKTIADSDTETEINRTEALLALTGGAIATPSRNPSPAARKPLPQRPVNPRQTYTPKDLLYVSFTGAPFNPYASAEEVRAPLSVLSSSSTLGAHMPNFDSGDTETHRKHYTRIESALFDVTRPSTPDFADSAAHRQHYSRIESGVFDVTLPSTPDFADSAAHRQHYSRIESGCFDSFAFPSPARPTNSTPAARSSIPPQAPAKPLPLSIKRKPVAAAAAPTRNFSRKMHADKSLPPSPGPTDPRRFTRGIVPAPVLAMNDNGFPMLPRQLARDSLGPRPARQQREQVASRRPEVRQQKAVEKQMGKMAKMNAACEKIMRNYL
ncbi:hypothetical protein LTR53_014838 [Teratosphaeriaceae sp. CCFEE 6253]|nr:hypothetical protein LTR53_014838 [Teratosphaeriaceae sp. CCFEE 6253]